MNDLISRKSLIENLNKFAPEHYNALVNMLIEKEPVAQLWIPCSKQMPTEDFIDDFEFSISEPVLITDEIGDVCKSYTVDGKWAEKYNVLAWMPLPEPYKETN